MKLFNIFLSIIFIVLSIVCMWIFLYSVSTMEPSDPITVELFSEGVWTLLTLAWAIFFRIETKNCEQTP